MIDSLPRSARFANSPLKKPNLSHPSASQPSFHLLQSSLPFNSPALHCQSEVELPAINSHIFRRRLRNQSWVYGEFKFRALSRVCQFASLCKQHPQATMHMLTDMLCAACSSNPMPMRSRLPSRSTLALQRGQPSAASVLSDILLMFAIVHRRAHIATLHLEISISAVSCKSLCATEAAIQSVWC